MDLVIIFFIENKIFYNSQFLNPCFEREILKPESLVFTHDLLLVLALERRLGRLLFCLGRGFIL